VLCTFVGLRYVAMAEVHSVGGSPDLIGGRCVDVPVTWGYAFEYPCDDRDNEVECGCVVCRREFYQL
jgi:hypothetical protein